MVEEGVTGASAGEPGSRELDQQAVPALTGFDPSRDLADAVAYLRQLAKRDRGAWCCSAVRRAQVAKQQIVWALGGADVSIGDDEIFIACLDAVAALAIEARSDATGPGAAVGKSAGRQATPTQGADNGQ